MTELADRVRHRLVADAALDGAVLAAHDGVVDDAIFDRLRREVADELIGAGPLERLLALDGVTDVVVNGPDSVWIDRGCGMERMSVTFPSDAAVRRLASRLANSVGRRLDDAAPFVDAVLADGTRMHALLPPLAAHPTISLRVLRRRRLDLDAIVASGAAPPPVDVWLRRIVSRRVSFLVTGGTGSGKTTLLGALLGEAAAHERLMLIEDAPELVVDHPHVVGLVTRPPNVEGAGGIGLRELVRQALRMRPDRLVVGEFRGAEIAELLVALNTGHRGSAATMHANSAEDVPARALALGALAGLSTSATTSLMSSGIDVVVHLERLGTRRCVSEIGLLRCVGERLRFESGWSIGNGFGPAAGDLEALLDRGVR